MMLTSAGHQNDLTRCRELGMGSHITKPLRQSELLDAIMVALGHTLSMRAAPAPPPPPIAAGRRLRVLLAEDNPVNQKLALGILDQAGPQRARGQ